MDPNYAQNTWNLLKNAITEIHRQNASGLSFEELYRNSYNMVLHKCGEKLYEGLREVVDEHLKEVAKTVANSLDDDFLVSLNKAWNDHKISMLMIRDILMYMDRVYVAAHNKPTVYDMGLQLFRDNVTKHERIKGRLLKTLLSLIHGERTGGMLDESLVKNIIQMLVDVGVNSRSVYEEEFENQFLETTATFYRVESQDFISSNSCPDYMKKIEARLKEEVQRVARYLDTHTEQKLKNVCEKEMITNHMNELVQKEDSGLIPLLRDDQVEDLSRMYRLFGRVSGGLDLMREMMCNYVKEIGKGLVTVEAKVTKKSKDTYVQALLDLKDKYDALLKNAFNEDSSFQKGLNQAFEYFINLNIKSPEYISLFIDEKLKKGLKGMTEEDVEIILNKVMTLFRFLQEKDVFEKYYKQHLAKRLLLGRSVSDDAERTMIAKLKTECGYQFTSKLEGMFQDMKISTDTMESFRSYIAELPKDPLHGVELNVYVLTTGFWPTAQTAHKCNLPVEITRCTEAFKNFYLKNHNGRRLTWQTNMGTADVRASFKSRMHELNVSTYQMIVLLLFNDSDTLSFKEVREATDIPIPDLRRNLQALSQSKYKILKASKGAKGEYQDTDKFMFNAGFKSKLRRIKVLLGGAKKESSTERKVTRDKISEDRKHQIEAAIIRIMKARKTLDHTNLVTEVTKQLAPRFMPDPTLIKKRIESLIERDYLERAKDNRKVYQYLA